MFVQTSAIKIHNIVYHLYRYSVLLIVDTVGNRNTMHSVSSWGVDDDIGGLTNESQVHSVNLL